MVTQNNKTKTVKPMMTETKKRIQFELDEVTRNYANGLVSITEKLAEQITIIDREREIYIRESLERHKQIEPDGSDYRTAHVLLHAHKAFDKALLTFTFAL